MATATDYDAPRRRESEETDETSIDEIAGRAGRNQSGAADVEEPDADEFELPDADLSGEELSVRVIPKQSDEFTCSSCFLVHHRSRLAREVGGRMVCSDCA